MTRIATWAFVLGVGFACPAAALPAPQDVPQAPELTGESGRIEAGQTLLKDAKYSQALEVLKLAVADKAFDRLPAKDKYLAYRSLAQAAFNAKDYDTAAARHDADDALTTLTKLAEAWPGDLPQLASRFMLFIVHSAPDQRHGEDREARLLKALFAVHWQPADESPDAADPAWLRLVLYHLNHNEGMKAVAVAATITHPNTLIALAADKRFDTVVAADPRHYEMPAAAEASLEGAKARMATHPDLLEPADTTAKALLRLGRADEALTVIDQALAKAQPASGASPYADLDLPCPG